MKERVKCAIAVPTHNNEAAGVDPPASREHFNVHWIGVAVQGGGQSERSHDRPPHAV